ncbi:MAG: DUF3881 family protein [Lachnospiraceae bacterium]|nr:DUF3881 family protein [Lachnospiraceae bacterium]
MHKFMRAVGFAGLSDRKDQQKLITDVILNPTRRAYTTYGEDEFLAEFDKDFAPGLGVGVCGMFDGEENFSYDYYYPYLSGTQISSLEDITVERHASQLSFAGICDDYKIGVSLIFYLQNMIPYVKILNSDKLPLLGTSLSLSGLSVQGSIILPIAKNERDMRKIRRASLERLQLLNKAKDGDEEAIDTITMEDMDRYAALKDRIRETDVFSLVDSYFMPYGVECDQYSILGEIIQCDQVENSLTGEKIWKLVVLVNDMNMDVCINEQDLVGEPAEGRRFKGSIWLQGAVLHPEL